MMIPSMPLVSIIVPLYQVKEYVSQCIKSLIQQTYSPIEIILVDDASNDDSLKIAESLLESSGVVWFTCRHHINRGLSAARNTGVQSAHGQFFLFVDSDDWIASDCVEMMVKSALAYHSDVVFAPHIDYYENGIFVKSPGEIREFADNPLEYYVSNDNVVHPSMAWNKLVMTDFYFSTKIAFEEGICYEDEPWSFLLMTQARRVSCVSKPTYFYRHRRGSITDITCYDLFRVKSRYFHLRNCTQTICEKNLFQVSGINKWFVRHILNFLRNMVFSSISFNEKKKFICDVFNEIYLPKRDLNKKTLYFFLPICYIPSVSLRFFIIKLYFLLKERLMGIYAKKDMPFF